MSIGFMVFERMEFRRTGMKNSISRVYHEHIPTSGQRVPVYVCGPSKSEEKYLI